MSHSMRLPVAVALALFAGLAIAPTASAQLSDESFDSPLTTADLQVFGMNTVDKWGVDSATVVASDPVFGINPIDGNQMLRVTPTAGATSSFSQIVGVEHLSSEIDLGQITATFVTCFNTPTGNSATASLEVFLSYLDGSGTPFAQSPVLTVTPGMLSLDTAVWDPFVLTDVAVPAGTRRIEAIVAVNSASLGGLPIFADKFHLEFNQVPEPAAGALVLLAAAGAFGRARRRG